MNILSLSFFVISIHAMTQETYSLDVDRSLCLRDLSIVNDDRARGDGAWSFYSMLLSIRKDSSDLPHFASKWIDQFSQTASLNGFKVTQRPTKRLGRLWPRLANGYLDLSRAPFRLLAIVFRPDLATEESPAGQGRFVFGVFDRTDDTTKEFYVIFEFNLPFLKEELFSKLRRLNEIPFGEIFNSELQIITDSVLKFGSLKSLRTNDFFLADVWEMRSFEFDSDTNQLKMSVLENTPDGSFNIDKRDKLVEYLKTKEDSIESDTFNLPLEFLAGVATAKSEDFSWLKDTNLDAFTRNKFSRMTCNGCHAGDTNSRFVHISNRRSHETSSISPFLESELKRRIKIVEEKTE